MMSERQILTVRVEDGSYYHHIYHPLPPRIVVDDNILEDEPIAICETRLPAYACTCGAFLLRNVFLDGSETWRDDECAFPWFISPRAAAIRYCGEPPQWVVPPIQTPADNLHERAIADDHDDHVKTLVDLARQGREQDFRDLGAMLGVDKDRLDDLWRGTVARVKT